MKIEKLILKEFIGISLAMNAKEIEIDFTKAKNKLCIFIGPNGCGKTTVLSLLNPFASLGNLDVRDGNGIINKNKNGYKEIHIRNNEDLYVIKHFYTPAKESHTVKSYISKNGVELNDHGNVTSFKEIVKEELDVELDYMKLIRLGANVTSLISLSTTERKNFMGKMLDDIGVYLQYFKKLSNDLNQLKTMIAFSAEKKNKLGIENKKEAKKELESLIEKVNEDTEKLTKLQGDLSVVNHELKKYDYDEIKSQIKEVEHKLSKMDKILDRKGELESTDPAFYEKRIKELEDRIQKDSNELLAVDILIKNKLSQLDETMTNKKRMEIQLEKEMATDKEISGMKDELHKLKSQIKESEDFLEGFTSNIQKKDLEDFIVFLKNATTPLLNAYDFGQKPVKKVISLLRQQKNVTSYITNQMTYATSEDDEILGFLNKVSQSAFSEPNIRDCSCGDSPCYLKDLWKQMHNIVEMRKESKKDTNDTEFLHYMEMVYSNLKLILPEFSKWKFLIEQFPDEVKDDFKLEFIYSRIESLKPIFDEKKLYDLLTKITELDNLAILEDKCESIKHDISRYKSMSNIDYVESELKRLTDSEEELSSSIASLKERKSLLDEQISSNKRDLETAEDLKETFDSYDSYESQYSSLMQDREDYMSNMEKVKEISEEVNDLTLQLRFNQERREKLVNNLSQYKEITKELKIYQKVFDEMTLEKRSLSSKEGISLHYIKDYLGSVKDIANDFMNIAYNGDIYLDEFAISPSEFGIPFINKGIRIDDVKLASQGELSFLNIALSLALASKQMTMFNIAEFDEMDAALDLTKREKFLQIIEKFMERAKTEQCFLISHNDMFSSYYVDIVDFSFENDTTKYPLANFINIKRIS